MHVLWFEFMLSLRRLARRKTQNGLMLVTFSVSIVLSLLSWSLFHTIFLRNPEFDPKGEFYLLSYVGAEPGSGWKRSFRTDLDAWKSQQTVFADFTGVVLYRSSFITTKGGAERVLGANLSSEALRMVGAQPLLGRMFTADEDKFGCAPVLLLSYRTWQNRFGGDPKILGQVVKVDEKGTTIIGVMPADFRFPNDQDILYPLGTQIDFPDYAGFDILVRLKPGVTRERAESEMQLLLSRRKDSPNFIAGLRPMLLPFRDYYLGKDMRVSALVLFALSLLFVAVSCSNAANLMMIDFLGRTPEVATSLALGLPRKAIIRGLCFQIGIIASVAAALGVAALVLVSPLLHAALAQMLTPYWLRFSFQGHHLAMALALAAVCSGAAIAAPIALLLWLSPEKVIRDGAGANRGTGRGWWRSSLLAGQIALLTILGIAAGLLVRSSHHLNESHWGYDAKPIFMGKLDVRKTDYPEYAKRNAVFRRVLDEVDRLPDVQASAVMAKTLVYSMSPNVSYALDPAAFVNNRPAGGAVYSEVTEGFFATMGVDFVAGTTFPRVPPQNARTYAVINRALAQKIWPGQDPLQRELYVRYSWMDAKEPTDHVVICGVVRDFQAAGPRAANNDGLFVPFDDWTPNNLFLLVRGKSVMPAAREITETAHRVDPRIALYFPDSLVHQITMAQGSVTLTARLTLVYAIAAVLLCAVGVYSLTVSQVIQRAREFGIRMALGIEPHQLWRHFTRTHLLTVLLGVGVGVVVSLQMVHVLQTLLFGVEGKDAPTFILVSAAIVVVAALACIPSLFRLKRINPADCLRSL